MTKKELVELLAPFPDDMQVRIWADHGQSCMPVDGVGEQLIMTEDIDNSMADPIHEDDADNWESGELTKILEISAW